MPFLSSSWVAFGRPSNLWAVLPGVPRHWRFPPASGGAIPPGLYPLRGGCCLTPEAPQKGECRRGRRYFWSCRTRVGFGPAIGPTLKRPCAIFVRWWDATIKTEVYADALRSHSVPRGSGPTNGKVQPLRPSHSHRPHGFGATQP